MIMQIIQHPVWHTVCAVLGRVSHVRLFATLWTVAHQVLQSMGFSRQEYWSGYIAISFSRGASQPRDQTQVACIAGRLLTI